MKLNTHTHTHQSCQLVVNMGNALKMGVWEQLRRVIFKHRPRFKQGWKKPCCPLCLSFILSAQFVLHYNN